jgi:hypothetical protein
MSKKDNRICKVCKEEYYFCPSCGSVSASDKYKIMYCSKNCYHILNTLSKLTIGTINKAEAKEALSSLDLSKQNQFSEGIKMEIDEIMKTGKKNKKKEKIDIVYNDEVVIVDSQLDNTVVENIEMQPIVNDEQDKAVVDIEPEFQVVI